MESIEVAKQLVQKFKDVDKQENKLLDIEAKLENIRNDVDMIIDSKNHWFV